MVPGMESLDWSKKQLISATREHFYRKRTWTNAKNNNFLIPFHPDSLDFIRALMILTATVLFQRIMFRKATLLGSFVSVLGSIVRKAWKMSDSLVESTVWFVADHSCRHAFLYNTNVLSFLTMLIPVRGSPLRGLLMNYRKWF
ncbi:hypothetical protein TNCV_4931521 [Trichonephila clavipes]|nr:hypothetical protein TNCV_4931521 [Trichonephila clavipes]